MLLAPLFLMGLLAIGLPLWLHRFARDTRTKQPFASLMLLEPSQIHRSREHTLKYFLLLALRIALLAMIVFAFVRPMLPWRTPPLEARDRTLHVIVLDTSLSMQGERWTRAVERARNLIGSLRSADQGMVVSADSRVRVVKGPLNQSDSEELRTAVSSLKPGSARLDYGMLMTSASSWLGTQRPATQLHLITDLQQSAAPLQFADLEPPQGVKLVLEDVGERGGSNQYVKAVAASEHDSDVIEVRVGGVDTLRVPRTVVLTLDGKERGRVRLGKSSAGSPAAASAISAEGALHRAPLAGAPLSTPVGAASQGRALQTPPGGSAKNTPPTAVLSGQEARALFPNIELIPGTHRITVTLEPSNADALPADDQFFSVLERREPRALVIGASSSADDVSYFAAAVGALTNPHLSVERTGSDALSQRPLADYSALIVSDAGVLSGASATNLQRYLEGGGSILSTLGPRAAQRDAIPLSGHVLDTRSLKAQSNSAGGNSGLAGRVAAVEESHPALRDAQGWRSIRFFRYVPIQTRPDDTVLIRFEDGHPLLIERHIGAGRLLVLTSPLDREWSDLAIHPLFVRFIGEATRYMTAGTAAPNTIVGAVLRTGVNGRNGAQVFDPSGKRVLALSDTTGRTRLFAERVGFYEVRGGGRSDWIAVNADPRESDLARMPASSIAQWNRLQTSGRVAANGSASERTGTVADTSQDASSGSQLKAIWPWLLLLAVTLAFIEPLVANSHLHVRRGVAS